jgi:hypothetical protein
MLSHNPKYPLVVVNFNHGVTRCLLKKDKGGRK